MPSRPATNPVISKLAIAGHPIHPMLIHFPVAALLGLFATDLAFVMTDDFFWARAGFWLATVGVFGGWLSGLIGLLDLILVRAIRRLVTAWCHGLMAVMLLSLATLNWMLRLGDPAALIVPWGLYLTLLSGFMIGLTSFLGGQLVYDHAVGVAGEKSTLRAQKQQQIKDLEAAERQS